MVLSTAQSRSAWYPACRSKGGTYLNAYRALDACLRRYGYKPGYGTGAFACRRITGGSGNSLHAYGPGTEFRFWNGYRIPSTALAVDINPPQNPYGRRLVTNMPRPMVDAIVRIRTNNGKQVWGWGGYFRRNKDAMHYEIVCSRSDLASGINPATVPGAITPPPSKPKPPEEDDDEMFTYTFDKPGAAPDILVLVAGRKQVRLNGPQVRADRVKPEALATHIGAVDSDTAARFVTAYGPIIT